MACLLVFNHSRNDFSSSALHAAGVFYVLPTNWCLIVNFSPWHKKGVLFLSIRITDFKNASLFLRF